MSVAQSGNGGGVSRSALQDIAAPAQNHRTTDRIVPDRRFGFQLVQDRFRYLNLGGVAHSIEQAGAYREGDSPVAVPMDRIPLVIGAAPSQKALLSRVDRRTEDRVRRARTRQPGHDSGIAITTLQAQAFCFRLLLVRIEELRQEFGDRFQGTDAAFGIEITRPVEMHQQPVRHLIQRHPRADRRGPAQKLVRQQLAEDLRHAALRFAQQLGQVALRFRFARAQQSIDDIRRPRTQPIDTVSEVVREFVHQFVEQRGGCQRGSAGQDFIQHGRNAW